MRKLIVLTGIGIMAEYCRVTDDPKDLCWTCYHAGECWISSKRRHQQHNPQSSRTFTTSWPKAAVVSSAERDLVLTSQHLKNIRDLRGTWRDDFSNILYWSYAHKETTTKNSRSR